MSPSRLLAHNDVHLKPEHRTGRKEGHVTKEVLEIESLFGIVLGNRVFISKKIF
jgi:hypothetical protein